MEFQSNRGRKIIGSVASRQPWYPVRNGPHEPRGAGEGCLPGAVLANRSVAVRADRKHRLVRSNLNLTKLASMRMVDLVKWKEAGEVWLVATESLSGVPVARKW